MEQRSEDKKGMKKASRDWEGFLLIILGHRLDWHLMIFIDGFIINHEC